ncbi:MAG: hypothetical protein ACWA5A_03595, partial [Marinibacterium sp.]
MPGNVELAAGALRGLGVDFRHQQPFFPVHRAGMDATEWLVDDGITGIHPFVRVMAQGSLRRFPLSQFHHL